MDHPGHSILLNHIEKTATIQPLLSPPPSPSGTPAMPHLGIPGAPAPSVQVQDLGKGVLKGLEVEGKRYLIQPPAMPNIPAPPKPPTFQAQGMPKAPGAPGSQSAPNAPQAPTLAEVWTSTSMRLPMLTKMNGTFGQIAQVCQSVIPGEPHPATFQIPPDYKAIQLSPPKPPTLPA